MNSRSTFAGLTFPALSFFSVLLFFIFTSTSGNAQLVIEGGPFGVTLSNRDGKVSGPVSSSNRDAVIDGRALSTSLRGRDLRGNSPYRVQNPPVPHSRSYSEPATVPVRQLIHPIGTPYYREVDIRRIQQYYALQRSLGVIRTVKLEEMVFPASRLFGTGRTDLSAGGKSLLNQVLTYLRMSESNGMRVAYQFASSYDSAERGRARSLAVMNYLSLKSGKSLGWFTMPPPQPLDSKSRLSKQGSLVSIALQRPTDGPRYTVKD